MSNMYEDLIMNQPNPFSMATDERVFVMRDEEKKKKIHEREHIKNLKVHEKSTWSTRIGSAVAKSRIEDERELRAAASQGPGGSVDEQIMTKEYLGKKKTALGYVPEMTEMSKEKTNMAEYITKKREMGLMRMSLATKKHEIRKLEEEAERAEKKIKQQEEQLDETIQKFQEFLKDNDMKAVEMMKKAEAETKGKQEKTAEIKKLSAQIAAISNDKTKIEEAMQACLRYKKFLDQLTPAQWFRETLCNIEIQRVREELERKLELKEMSSDADPQAAAAQQAASQADIEAQLEDARSLLMDKLSDMPDMAVLAELNIMDPDIVPMFFTDPEKILNIFMEIEENNLFLIQNCQETEEALEELKSKFDEAKIKMDQEAANLKSQIEQIKQRIAVEEAKKKALMQRMTSSKDSQKQETNLNNINMKVTEIFKASGFGDNDANINTLGMLTKIETKLEELRNQIVRLPHDFVSAAMKQRDKERRQRARQKLLDEQRASREFRSQKALARSQAPVIKKVGKPVMWRSRPIDKRKMEVVTDDNDGEFDDSEFFM
eukprot:TRINITY_DN67944_c0_g2_i1.p1 TRINITY_DN67944_c0_g2~~TRINITY_DN67944_c0_g2_i1.p1  ORF type:complete len:547 (-),score=95.14 TRINITY_DN67944_c0_g2_i1:118-1758(-)